MRLNPENFAYILGVGKVGKPSTLKARHKLRGALAILTLCWESLLGN